MGGKLALGSEHTVLNPQTMQRGTGAPLHPFTAAHALNLETSLGRSLSLADTPSRMFIKNKSFESIPSPVSAQRVFPDSQAAAVPQIEKSLEPTLKPPGKLPGPRGKERGCHNLTMDRGRSPQFPHLRKETPKPCSPLSLRESAQQALPGGRGGNCHQPRVRGRAAHSGPGPLARAVAAPLPGLRVRPQGNGGHTELSSRAPAPLAPGAPVRGTGPLPGARPARRARCAPAAGHSPSGGPAAPPRPGGTAAVSSSGNSSGSSARAAQGQPRPATPMEGAAAAGRDGGARAASAAAAPGGVCGRPARRALTPPARPRPAPEPRPHFHTVLRGPPLPAPSLPPHGPGGGGAAAVAGGRLSAWRGWARRAARPPPRRPPPQTRCSRTAAALRPAESLVRRRLAASSNLTRSLL